MQLRNIKLNKKRGGNVYSTKIIILLFIIISSLFASSPIVVELDISGTIGPASSAYVKNGIKIAAKQDAQILLIKLDTTNGLSTSMKKIVQDIVNAKIPIIMYVHPKDIYAKSLDTHFMHITNIDTIDLSTNNTQELLNTLNEKSATIAGKKFIFNTSNPIIIKYKADLKTKFLHTITNPNILYILLIIAIYGLFFEFANPGGIVPGVVGLISAAIVFYALTLLPFNYIGLLLIIFGVGFIIAEIFISTFGVLGIGGVISFALGSFLLFNANTLGSSVSISLIIAFTIVNVAFFILMIKTLVRSRSTKIITGKEDIIGSKAEVIDVDEQTYHVLYKGEIWNALCQDKLTPKQEVEVVGLSGLTLDVKPIKE